MDGMKKVTTKFPVKGRPDVSVLQAFFDEKPKSPAVLKKALLRGKKEQTLKVTKG
jgi:hypothetical protein